VDNLKLEVEKLDGELWIAAATYDDPYGFYFGKELSETALNRVVATTALLESVGLPAIIGLTEDMTLTFFEFFPEVQFHWYNPGTGCFEMEKPLPPRQFLHANFVEQQDGSWLWRSPFACDVELVQIENKWLACATPRPRKSETVKRLQIYAESNDRERAAENLLKDKRIAQTFGLTQDRYPLVNLHNRGKRM
jgi:hypothetical protein